MPSYMPSKEKFRGMSNKSTIKFMRSLSFPRTMNPPNLYFPENNLINTTLFRIISCKLG